jgi:hypothetical protein
VLGVATECNVHLVDKELAGDQAAHAISPDGAMARGEWHKLDDLLAKLRAQSHRLDDPDLDESAVLERLAQSQWSELLAG